MEFSKVAEDEELEVHEATEPVEPSGRNLDQALKALGRDVVACGFDGTRFWARVRKET